MTVENLLSRLKKVKSMGKDRWKACCPAHGGDGQSLAIRDDAGKVLVHCFAYGCDILDVLGAVSLSMEEVQPRLGGEFKSQKKAFYAGDVLDIVRDEILIAHLICKKMLDGTVNFNDSERLQKCVSRLWHAQEQANGIAPLPKYKEIKNA